MSVNYLANIFLLFFIVFILIFYRRVHGFWLNPSCIFISFWLVFISIPLIVVFDGPISVLAVLYIVCFLFFFGLSSCLFDWGKAVRLNSIKSELGYEVLSSSRLKIVFYFLFFISIITNIYFVHLQGFSLLYAIGNIKNVGAQIAEMRYTGRLKVDFITVMSNFCVYFLVYFGGILYAFDQHKKRYVVFTFTPVLLILLLQSSKGILFFSIVLFYGCVLLKNIFSSKLNFLSYKSIYKLLLMVIILCPFIIISFLSRGLADLPFERQVSGIYKFFVSYSSGHLFAFSAWFTERYLEGNILDHFDQRVLELGLYTFKSFFSLFGAGSDIGIGIYDEYVTVAARTLKVNVYPYYVDSDDIVVSNIYTIFRGLIIDYTLVGSIIFGCFLGGLINFIFYRLLTKRFSMVSFVVFPYFVAFSYQSYIVSSFTWITIPLSMVSIWGVLFLLKHFKVNIN